ncbi:unnamed protein product, partial [Didymodactylos carnosus]
MFRLPLRVCKSEISQKVHTSSTIIKLLDSFIDELSNCVLFLKNIRSVKISKLDENGQMCTVEEVTVCPQSSDDESSIRTVSNILSNIQDRSALLQGTCHSVNTYYLDISSIKSGKQSYLIASGIGFTSDIQKSLYKDSLKEFDNLKCLPVGACAYLLTSLEPADSNGEQNRKSLLCNDHFLYCFLPLPISIDIPVHIHGYFCLSNESRYNLWETDDETDLKRLWNKALAEYLLSQCYVEIICRAAEQVQRNLLTLTRYLALFLNKANIKDKLIQLLIEKTYETFFSRDLPIIPTTLKIGSRDSFMWTHVSDLKLYFVNAFELFVSKSGRDNKYINDCCHTLLSIDMKICHERELIQIIKYNEKSMQDLNPIQLCNELCKINLLSIDDTVFTHKSIYMFLSFILSDKEVAKKHLAGCPLLLRADDKVCCFDKNNTLYGFWDLSTFKNCLDRFIHPILWDIFITADDELQKCWLKELKINDLADILPKILDKDTFYKNDDELYMECELEKDIRKRDILNIWAILENNLRPLLPKKDNSESNRNDVRSILLEELDPIKYWCLIPIKRHSGRFSDDKKEHFAPFTVVDMMFYQDYDSGSSFYWLLKAKVLVMDSMFFVHEYDNSITDILKYLTQNAKEPTEVLDVLLALSDRTPSFYIKLDTDGYTSILQCCDSIFSTLKGNEILNSYALKVEKLPIFMNISGQYERLSNRRRIYVPSDMPLNYFNEISQLLDIQFLKDPNIVGLSIEEYLKIKFMTVYELYDTILDCLTKAEVTDRIEHMNYLRIKYKFYDDKNDRLKTKLQSFEFITDNEGYIQSASYFYNHDVELFRLTIPSSRFLPKEFSNTDWLRFLSCIGFQNELNEENALFVISELKKKNILDENGIRAAYNIMENTRKYSKPFFDQASLIKFIPNAVNDELMRIIQISSHLVATQNACKYANASLCWTEVGILPEKISSLDMSILEQFKICQKIET